MKAAALCRRWCPSWRSSCPPATASSRWGDLPPEGRPQTRGGRLREAVAGWRRASRSSRSTTSPSRSTTPAAGPDRRAASLRDGRGPLPPQPHGGGSHFRGSPVVRLRGVLNSKKRPTSAAVSVIGALGTSRSSRPLPPCGRRSRWTPRDREGRGRRAVPQRIDDGRGGPDGPPPAHGPAARDPDPGEGAADIDLPAVTSAGADRRARMPLESRCPGARRTGPAVDLVHFKPRLVKTRRAGGGRRERRRRRVSSARTTRRAPASGGQGKGK